MLAATATGSPPLAAPQDPLTLTLALGAGLHAPLVAHTAAGAVRAASAGAAELAAMLGLLAVLHAMFALVTGTWAWNAAHRKRPSPWEVATAARAWATGSALAALVLLPLP